MKLNPVLLEEDRHRRINVLVGAADFESALTQRRRHGAHGGAANPDEMKFLQRGFHKRLFTSSREVRQQEKNPKVSVVIQVSHR